MKNTVFNANLELYCLRYISRVAPITDDPEFKQDIQRARMIALVFEQFLLFDKVAIKLDRTGVALVFLIDELGLNDLEALLERKVIELVLWTPLIFTGKGIPNADGTYNLEEVLGTPPIVSANYIKQDLDPNVSLDGALRYFKIDRDRRRIFKRIASKQYVYPNQTAENAVQLTMDAYDKNYLAPLGLPYSTKPELFDFDQRSQISELSHDILETSVLAELGYVSYDKYSSLSLTQSSVKTIESGLKVSDNTSEILQLENLPNIQALVMSGVLGMKDLLTLRNKGVVKDYRVWINNVSKSGDYTKISKEYIDEVIGKRNFMESTGGKFLRTTGMFGVGLGIGVALGGPVGAALGLVGVKAVELGLSLFDTFTLDGILKGWNPRMFVDEIAKATKE